MAIKTINREDFLAHWTRTCGLSFSQARRLFDAMVDVFKDGVVNGARIRIGRLGMLYPGQRQPKTVHMGFRRVKGGRIEKQRHVYFMDRRIVYRMQIYKRFIDTHNLHWYSDHWPVDDELRAEAASVKDST